MKKIISLFLVLMLLSPAELQAGKSYSSGGSRSSGSRGSSFGSSSKGSSFSGRTSGSTGKSYSLGSSSKSPSHSISTPSSKTYSSAPKPIASSPSSKPSTSTQSGKTYSSSAKPITASPPSGKTYSSSSKPATTPVGQSGKSYSSNSASTVPNNSTVPKSNISSDGNSRKPTGSSTYNKSLSDSAKKEQSKQAYVAKTTPAATPKSTYTPAGTNVQKTINPQSAPVQTVRRYVTHERYVTYDNRLSSFYGPYYGRPAYYSDYFSPFLMGWLMSDALNSHQRALWVYHHQDQMDQARYAELLRRDAQLQAEINQLKAQNVVQDSNYVPPQMADNPDLMYSKEFVDAAYNPVQSSVEPVPANSGGWWRFFLWTFVLGGVAFAVYLLFFREF